MKFSALSRDVPGYIDLIGGENIDITDICIDSRKVTPGALFFCTPGLKMDAHDFAPQALDNGAAALVVERKLDVNCPQLIVEDVRAASAEIAARFYGRPADSLTLIALTGTKGKTTCSYLVKSILEFAGYKTGLIGTVGTLIGKELIPTRLTTPDAIDIQRIFRSMVDVGVTHVVMEVSAHALALERLNGLRFAVSAFTNLSQDHLDMFGDVDTYLKAKLKLFKPEMTDKIVYNADDETVARAIEALGRAAIRVGISMPADVYENDIEIMEPGYSFILSYHKRYREPVRYKLSGLFNVYNALTAAGVASALGIKPEHIKSGLEAVRNVPGRIELLDTDTPYKVILDYAHSPDSLENVLSALRDITKGGRVIALFGCGGDRDQLKRPIMGEIAGTLADFCILTSDNPRGEDPYEILNEIEEGIRRTDCEYIVIENRRDAIRRALEMARAGDTIVLAGKGHETYQEIMGIKHPFDEKLVVAELLASLKQGG